MEAFFMNAPLIQNNKVAVAAHEMGRLGPLSGGQPYTEGWAACFRDGRSPLLPLPFAHFPFCLPSIPPLTSFPVKPPPVFSSLHFSSSPHLCRTTTDHSQTRGNGNYQYTSPRSQKYFQVKNVTVGGEALMKCTVANR